MSCNFELLSDTNVLNIYSLAKASNRVGDVKIVRGLLGDYIFDCESLSKLEPVICCYLGQTGLMEGEISVYSLGGTLTSKDSSKKAWTVSLDRVDQLLAMGLGVGVLETVGDFKKTDPNKIMVKLKEQK